MKEFYWDTSRNYTIGDALRSMATGWKAQNAAPQDTAQKDRPCS